MPKKVMFFWQKVDVNSQSNDGNAKRYGGNKKSEDFQEIKKEWNPGIFKVKRKDFKKK